MPPSPATQFFDALSNRHRRQLFFALMKTGSEDGEDLDPLTLFAPAGSTDEPEETQMELIHRHLPKLAEMGFIEWDRAEGTVTTGPNWEMIAPSLQLMRNHSSKFPEGVVG